MFTDDYRILIALLCWVLAWIANAASDAILFRYEESIFANWGSWWKLNSRPDLWKKYPYFPFIWDGWHFIKWLTWAFLYVGLGLWNIWMALIFALIGFAVFKLFYGKIFVR